MQRELSVERRGEYFHVEFHNYMGPWEGHQIEKLLDLEEVEAPPDPADYASVLKPGQAYLWHAMDFDPALHALITEDKLPIVAQIVRDRRVKVVEGGDLLPEPPAAHVKVEPGENDESYVAYIEERHRSSWERGPKAVVGSFLLRAVPVVIVLFAIVVIGRHVGDKYETVPLGEMFARAGQPTVEQGTWDRWMNPDHSHLVRHEIRSIRYAAGETMILGDGQVLAFEGARDVTPWLMSMQSRSAPIVVDAVASDGVLQVQQVTCGGEKIGGAMALTRVARLAESDGKPLRDATGDVESYRTVDRLEVDRDAPVDELVGALVSVHGRVVREGERRVLRTASGAGIVLDTTRVAGKLVDHFGCEAPQLGAEPVDQENELAGGAEAQ